MYRSEPLFAYAHGLYAILPPDLLKRFYPEEEGRIYRTDRYVICFNDGITDDIKQRIIQDCAAYYANQE